MKIDGQGRVTIPQRIRELLGLLPNTEVAFQIEGDRLYLEKAGMTGDRGRDLIRRMRGAATIPMTTDEIMDLTRS